MSAENIQRTGEEQKEKKPSMEGEVRVSTEQQSKGGKVIFEAPRSESTQGKENVSSSKDKQAGNEEQRKGVKYIGEPEAKFGHPVFSGQIEAADPLKRFRLPRSAGALPGTMVRSPRPPRKP